MCGILFHVGPFSEERPPWWNSLVIANEARGPDSSAAQNITQNGWTATIQASVLGLRGENVIEQPLQSLDGNILLCWNGEIFNSANEDDDSFLLRTNDAELLMSKMDEHMRIECPNTSATSQALANILSSVDGPYAFLVVEKKTSRVYYGRDPLGRRSLLRGHIGDADIICSVASKKAIDAGVEFRELDSTFLWSMSIGNTHRQEEKIIRKESIWTKSLRLTELEAPTTSLLTPSSERVVDQFLEVLRDSVRRRVTNIRPQGESRDSQVAVLFSGGLDCSTLAMIAHEFISVDQPIDLLNVAFENPRVLKAALNQKSDSSYTENFAVPDRKTGLSTFKELSNLAPDRQWNFVKINVTHEEYLNKREEVMALMSPQDSVMDLSIAAALFFASRRVGLLHSTILPAEPEKIYSSPARVVLSGLGADELLGGYSRHRKAFRMRGTKGLIEELQMDLDRIPTRNLGRDDRIISSSSVEARYPFLARPFLHFMCSLPVKEKMNLNLIEGEGDKMLLREAAKRLGMVNCATEKKRAIQFGARSAKLDVGGGKVKGHEKLVSSVAS